MDLYWWFCALWRPNRGPETHNADARESKQCSALVDNALSVNSRLLVLCYVHNCSHMPCSRCLVYAAVATRPLVYMFGGKVLCVVSGFYVAVCLLALFCFLFCQMFWKQIHLNLCGFCEWMFSHLSPHTSFNMKCMHCQIGGKTSMLCLPIWFQVQREQREQCAHAAPGRCHRQGPPRAGLTITVASRDLQHFCASVSIHLCGCHFLQFFDGLLDCNSVHLVCFVRTSCTCAHWLSCCIFFLPLLVNYFADLDVPSLFQKILIQHFCWIFSVLAGVHFACCNVDWARHIEGVIDVINMGTPLSL